MFSTTRAATLAPYREGIDLAIKTKKAPLYRPLYPLSLAELEVLQEYLQENLKKGFI